jgi:peptidoglycan hydrolase-like protein with peptidoglycan-binding domain
MPGKKILASVGDGGANRPVDVMTVQYLLNCVPAEQGGPSEELPVDGVAGAKTVEAIRRFQAAQFGGGDGRIDSEATGGRTMPLLQRFDPFPELELLDEGLKRHKPRGKYGPAGKQARAKDPVPDEQSMSVKRAAKSAGGKQGATATPSSGAMKGGKRPR